MEIKAKHAPHIVWLLFKCNATAMKVLPNNCIVNRFNKEQLFFIK